MSVPCAHHPAPPPAPAPSGAPPTHLRPRARTARVVLRACQQLKQAHAAPQVHAQQRVHRRRRRKLPGALHRVSATQSAPSASASSSRTTPSVDRPCASRRCAASRRAPGWPSGRCPACASSRLRPARQYRRARGQALLHCRSASLRSCLKASSLAVRVPGPFCQLSRATPEGRNDSLTSSQRRFT